MSCRYHRSMQCLMALACLLLILPATAAEVYRWTDQNGQVHFSQRPPPGGAQRMELPETAPAGIGDDDEITRRRQRERRLLESYEYERTQKKARQARAADKQQQIAAHCRKLQEYWQRLSFPGPVYVTRDDGERDYLSDARRSAEKARIKPAYVRACGRQP